MLSCSVCHPQGVSCPAAHRRDQGACCSPVAMTTLLLIAMISLVSPLEMSSTKYTTECSVQFSLLLLTSPDNDRAVRRKLLRHPHTGTEHVRENKNILKNVFENIK